MLKNRIFNIIIVGTGGQGLITLLQIIAEAADIQDLDVKTAELHGLSQRGGSISTHIRIGKKVETPLVPVGSADLVISLEYLETLRVLSYANSETIFLINNYSFPFLGTISEKEIEKKINQAITGNKHICAASELCQNELGKEVLSGIYLLGFACYNDLLPIKLESVKKAIRQVVPKNYQEINLKAIELASKNAN